MRAAFGVRSLVVFGVALSAVAFLSGQTAQPTATWADIGSGGSVPHGAAAFSLQASGDIVLVQEVSRSALRTVDAGEVLRTIRAAVRREHDLEVTVVLIKPATLPRTTSGKVQRRETANVAHKLRISIGPIDS